MPSATAKKSPKSTPPTWSKIEGGRSKPKPKAQGPKPKPQSSPRPRAQSPRARIEIPAHIRRELVALLMLVVGMLFIVGLVGWNGGAQNIVGAMGSFLAQLFGLAAWLVPLVMIAGATVLLMGAKLDAKWLSPLVPAGSIILLLGVMGFLHIFTNGQRAADLGQGGGYLGLALSTFLSDYLTKLGAMVVLLALIVLGVMLAFGLSLVQVVRGVGRPTLAASRAAAHALTQVRGEVSTLLKTRSAQGAQGREPVRINGEDVLVGETARHPTLEITNEDGTPLDSHSLPTEAVSVLGDPSQITAVKGKEKPSPLINVSSSKKMQAPPIQVMSPLGYTWNLPALTLLENTGEIKISQSDIKAKIKTIEETLLSFKVEATVREVNTGPAVTQFAIEPGVGVHVNKFTNLDRNLALALAAPDIRIEAPIPGQSRIGIEVPNVSLQVVGLRSIMESEESYNSKARLKIALGRDTHGRAVVTGMEKLPHLLVAGATGSGKSVFLNSIVIGFLLQFTPDDLRMLMIDPKRVELTGFNGIPHLLRPVVTDIRMEKESGHSNQSQGPKPKVQSDRERPLTAVEVLKWALWEMERRYKLFAKGAKDREGISKVFRNIEQYRAFTKDNPDAQMEHVPYIVIIIDELADLMLTAPEEVETSLCRLAQLARATGIHLVVATQRPSVDVVTGLIKANFPARAAFAVTSQVDSKVILDASGAEKLLGRGDMLYTASDESKPVRIQGTYVSDAESDRIVNFWRKQLPTDEQLADNGVEPAVQPMPMPDWLGTGDPDAESEMLEQAIELVKKHQYVSVSMLQRKLRVGYNRAARLVEQMEEMGLIAPATSENRGKPREVLLGAPDHRAFDAADADADADAEP